MPPIPANFSLERALQRIKTIQELLQSEKSTFDESLALYEEAELLIQQSQVYLNEAELRISSVTDAGNGTEEADL